MKKKKIKLHFDKKVISNLTQIQGGQEIGGGLAQDAKSIRLCNTTLDPTKHTNDPRGLCVTVVCTGPSQRRNC